MSDSGQQGKRITAEEFFADWERKPWEPRIVDGKLRRHAKPQPQLSSAESERLTRAVVHRSRLWIACGKLQVTPSGYVYDVGEEKIKRFLGIS